MKVTHRRYGMNSGIFRRFILLAVATLWLPSLGCTTTNNSKVTEEVAPTVVSWKMVTIIGDQRNIKQASAAVNTNKAISSIKLDKSLIVDFSRLGIKTDRATVTYLSKTFKSLALRPNQGCLLNIIGEGSPQGMILGTTLITPSLVDSVLNKHCSKTTSLVLVSGCYAGSFTHSPLAAPSRMIFTASRDDRNSPSCGSGSNVINWNACMAMTLPRASSWSQLPAGLSQCTANLERKAKQIQAWPQSFIGSKVPLKIRSRKAKGMSH